MNGLTKTSLSVAHPVVRPIRGGLSRPLAARSRKAFTLVEVLVVITIIAILASMVTYGVNRGILFSRQVSVKAEMSQIEVALANAARELGNVQTIPSFITLKDDISTYDTTNDQDASSLRQLQLMFPGLAGIVDWNNNGKVDSTTLTSEQAWVFFLGGIPGSGGVDGFARGPNPTVIGGKRKGPFFDFKPSRLAKQTNDFYIYLDYWEKNSLIVYSNYGKNPNLYFNATNLDKPFYISGAPNRYFLKPNKLFNPNGYQIISAGKDGVFGTSQSGNGAAAGFIGYGEVNSVSIPDADKGGADDQANFSDSLLAKPID